MAALLLRRGCRCQADQRAVQQQMRHAAFYGDKAKLDALKNFVIESCVKLNGFVNPPKPHKAGQPPSADDEENVLH